MSSGWLKKHIKHFVVPGIRALAKVGGECGVVSADPPQWMGRTRPSTKCDLPELGVVYATVASVLKKDDETRDRALALCRTLFDGGIDGLMPNRNKDEWREKYGIAMHDVMHAILCNSVRSLRRRVRKSRLTVVLPGRDVWAFEVMAQRKRVPTVYDARVSRAVSSNAEVCRGIARGWNVAEWRRSLVFDTGFRGSIWRDICAATGERPRLLLLSADVNKYQLFPGHTGSRQKALAFEYLPKYWTRGTPQDGVPMQHLNGLREFIDAALLTIWLWHHVSPRRVRVPRESKPKPAPKPSTATPATTATPTTTPFIATDQWSIGGGGALNITNQWLVSDATTTGGLVIDGTDNNAVTGFTWGGGASVISNVVTDAWGNAITG